jgi:hypothetical protein
MLLAYRGGRGKLISFYEAPKYRALTVIGFLFFLAWDRNPVSAISCKTFVTWILRV